MIRYWNEMEATAMERWMNHIRQWLLVMVVSWLAGWGLVDITIRAGEALVAPTLVAVAEVVTPQRG